MHHMYNNPYKVQSSSVCSDEYKVKNNAGHTESENFSVEGINANMYLQSGNAHDIACSNVMSLSNSIIDQATIDDNTSKISNNINNHNNNYNNNNNYYENGNNNHNCQSLPTTELFNNILASSFTSSQPRSFSQMGFQNNSFQSLEFVSEFNRETSNNISPSTNSVWEADVIGVNVMEHNNHYNSLHYLGNNRHSKQSSHLPEQHPQPEQHEQRQEYDHESELQQHQKQHQPQQQHKEYVSYLEHAQLTAQHGLAEFHHNTLAQVATESSQEIKSENDMSITREDPLSADERVHSYITSNIIPELQMNNSNSLITPKSPKSPSNFFYSQLSLSFTPLTHSLTPSRMYAHNPYGASLDNEVESRNKIIDANKDSSDSENNYNNNHVIDNIAYSNVNNNNNNNNSNGSNSNHNIDNSGINNNNFINDANDNNIIIGANCEMLPISVYTRAKMNRSNGNSFRAQNMPTLLNAKIPEAPFYNEWQQTRETNYPCPGQSHQEITLTSTNKTTSQLYQQTEALNSSALPNPLWEEKKEYVTPLMSEIQGNISGQEMCAAGCYSTSGNSENKPLHFINKVYQGNMCSNYMPYVINTTQPIPMTFISSNSAIENTANTFAPVHRTENVFINNNNNNSKKHFNVSEKINNSSANTNVYNNINTASNNEWQQFVLQKQEQTAQMETIKNNPNMRKVNDALHQIETSELECNQVESVELEFRNLIGQLYEAALTVHGRDVLTSILHLKTTEQVNTILSELIPQLNTLVLDAQGVNVFRAIIEILPTDQLISSVLSHLSSDTFLLLAITSQQTRRALESLWEQHDMNMLDHHVHLLIEKGQFLCVHQQGCLAMTRLLQHATRVQKQQLVIQLLPLLPNIAVDQYGNYLIQALFQYWNELESLTQNITGILFTNILQLSFNKFGSNVMEKLIELIDVHARTIIVQDLVFNRNNLRPFMQDRYANFVLQALINSCNSIEEFELISREVLHEIHCSPYGHKIEAKLNMVSNRLSANNYPSSAYMPQHPYT